MSQTLSSEIIEGLKSGRVVPYLGAGALKASVNAETQMPIPADSDFGYE
jgi:hypothetical protein